MAKVCVICDTKKDLVCFHKNKIRDDGHDNRCKLCKKELSKVWYEKNIELVLKKQKEYRDKDPGLRLAYLKSWKQKNRKKCCEYSTKYLRHNRDKVNAYRRKQYKHRYKNDLSFKITTLLRNRLRDAIHRGYKGGSAIRELGCTVSDLKIHIESQFQNGMTWENWSQKGWHVDHIIPLSSFDLTIKGNIAKACHYTNLQPLWAKDNMKKGNRYE